MSLVFGSPTDIAVCVCVLVCVRARRRLISTFTYTHTLIQPLSHMHTHTHTHARAHTQTHTHVLGRHWLFPWHIPAGSLAFVRLRSRRLSRRRSCVHVLVHAWARARSPPQLTTIELTLEIDTIEIPRDTIEIPRDTTEIPRKTVTRMQIEITQQTDSCIQGCTSLHRQTDRCTDR